MIQIPVWLGRIIKQNWLSFISVVFLVSLWEAAVDLDWVHTVFLVSPSTIVKSTMDLLINGDLPGHLAITLFRMFAGFFIGTALGLVIGLAMGWSKAIRAILDPIVSVIYPLPKIALLPLIMLLIGIGEKPMIMVIAFAAFFPVLVNSIAGVLSIDPIYFDAARNYGASRFKVLTKVIVPGSLPMVLVGIRLALGMSLLMAVVTELLIATKGLGAMLWLAWATLRIERIYVAIFIIALLGLIMHPLLNLIGRRLVPWREER